MKKKLLLVFLAILFANLPSVNAQTCDQGKYVVGYMPSWSGSAQAIQYDKLSHVIYAFIRPTTTGGLTALDNPQKLRDIVSLAHAQNVKVMIAVGGWSDLNNADFQSMASNSSYRSTFINNIVNFINTYQLDGVDIDWEYPREGNDPANFATLMTELGNAMHSRGKLLTAAVSASGYYADGVQNSVFNAVDFLNLMVYDGGDGAAHSPYSYAVSSLDYWLGRGLPASKAVLGVPFYARPGFASYSSLLAQGASPNADVFNGAYYNGIPTIKQKAELGKSRGAGIMIWELSQDVTGANSLLSAINTVIKPCNNGGNGNIFPTVSITSPSNGTNYTSVPASITINASASDADGTVSKVEFFNGSVKLGEDLSAPYSYTWNNVAGGSYSITAKATDNAAGTASTSVNVTVGLTCTTPAWNPTSVYTKDMEVSKDGNKYQARWWTQNNDPVTNSCADCVWKLIGPCGGTTNASPSASLTAPANNSTYTAPASITISASASDTDGTIAKVEFYNGSTKLGEDTNSPYSYTWNNVAAGTYSLTAKATDNAGGTGTSSARTVTVNGNTSNTPPAVSLSAPANGATYNAPASITISANASDSDGSVTQVAFYSGSTLLGTDNSSPYSYSWTNVAAGTYTITARATDDDGAITTSASRSVTVNGNTGTCSGKPNYVENGGYVAGSQVQNQGSLYECKPYPYSGWCNGASWAYAPGTGTYWTDAWTLIGSCSGARLAGPETKVSSLDLSVYPNPSLDGETLNIDLDGLYKEVKVSIQNISGGKQHEFSYHNTNKIQMSVPALSKGILIIRVVAGDRTWTRKLLKK